MADVSASSDLVMGLDIGTTGVKAVVMSVEGALLATADAGYPTAHPQPGWAEQNPADWWAATLVVMRQVVTGIDAWRVRAIGLSGQMHGAVLLDERGTVVRPCIIWSDQRTEAECDAITATVGEQALAQWVANPVLPGFTAPKLMWLRRHEPENWARSRSLLLPKDDVRYRLTGEQATDVSDAAGTLLFDVVQRRWSASMLAALDIDAALVPPCLESMAVAGQLRRDVAEQTGLMAGIPVVAGGADNACAALASGVASPGTAVISLGTSGTVVVPTAGPIVDQGQRVHTFNHAAPEVWYLMGVMQAAGLSLRWVRDLTQPAGTGDPYDTLALEAAATPVGADGLLWLPYLQGERTPHRDAAARGVLFGVGPRHGRGHVARAVMEGVAFGLRDAWLILQARGVAPGTAMITGGGARSALWRQIVADVLGIPLARAHDQAGPAVGAALLALVGAGRYPSVGDALAAAVPVGELTEPDAANYDRYAALHAEYVALYRAVQPNFRTLARAQSA